MQSEKATQAEKENKATATATSKRAVKKSSAKATTSALKNKDATTTTSVADKKTTTKKATKTAAKAGAKSPSAAQSQKSQPAKTGSTKNSGKKSLLITFQVAFCTKFGQVIKVGGNHPQLGDGSDEKALPLDFADLAHWSGQTRIDRTSLSEEGLQYYYLVQHSDGTIDKSSTYFLRPGSIPGKANHVFLCDAWNSPAFMENAFSTDVFKVLLKQPAMEKSAKRTKSSVSTGTHFFSIKAPALAPTQAICLVGNLSELGSWDTTKVTLLQPDEHSNAWQISLPLKTAGQEVQYKYGIYDTAAGQFICFESGDNRTLSADQPTADQVQIHDGFVRTN